MNSHRLGRAGAMRRARVLIMSAVALQAAFTPRVAAACTLYHEQRRIVSHVLNGDTLVLDTGEEVKLVGALPPQAVGASPPADTGLRPDSVTADALTRSALAGMTAGRPVEIAASGRRTDRYGRLLAHVFLTGASTGDGDYGAAKVTAANVTAKWVQGRMIGDGLARAYALPGSTACLEDLIAAEQTARAGHRGHWATGEFVDRDATMVRDLLALADTFQTVTGRIAQVARGRGNDREATLLTFETPPVKPRRGETEDGSRRFQTARAMSVVVPARRDGGNTTSAAASLGSRPKRGRAYEGWLHLIGAEVRVRGWIEPTSAGPRITLTDTREIEVLTVAAVNPQSSPATASQSAPASPEPPYSQPDIERQSPPAAVIDTGR